MSGSVASTTSAPAVTRPPPAQASATEAGSLLPESEPLSAAGMNDALSALYLALSQSRQAGVQSGEQQVEEQKALEEKAIADAKAAMEQQAADQQSGGFWHDLGNIAMVIAKVAMAVVAVAATVVTAGAASPILIAVAFALMAGGMIVSETKCFGDKASAWIGLGMEVASSVLTCGAGMGAAGATAGSQLASNVSTAASVVGAGATAVGAGAHIASAEYTADSQNAGADVVQSQQQVDQMNRLIGWVIDSTKEDDKSQQRAEGSLQGAMATNDATAVEAAPVPMKG
jgi:hypothetical protein